MLPTNRQNLAVPVKLLGFTLTNWSPILRFSTLCAAVFSFYLIYGYFQELIFHLPGMQPFGWFLTLVQFIIYSTFSYSELRITNSKLVRTIPWRTYFQIAFYTVATMGLSNAAVGYLNYPTQVIFKCCKLIPVLIGGIIIQGKRYGALDVAAAILMSLGLVMFSLADSQVSPNFDSRGYIMICSALIADAIIGNVQEKAMREYGASNNEVVLFSYSIGCVYILVFVLITGELFSALYFFAQHPIETYGYALLYSAVGYMGVNVVLTLVRVYGALIAVTVTTMRKAVTIILSFYFFAKPFTMGYVWAGLVILLAIYLNVYSKNRHAFNVKMATWWLKLTQNDSKTDAMQRKLIMKV